MLQQAGGQITDQATHASGLALLREAAQFAAESALSHQLHAIEAIRAPQPYPEGNPA